MRLARTSSAHVLATLVASVACGYSQQPVITAVVDAASYTPTGETESSIVTIFGANLASTTAAAQATPLPQSLGGTTVTWSGISVALFYVSPTQINIEAPNLVNLAGGGRTGLLVVTTAAGSSSPYSPGASPGAWGVMGLFSADSSGCGQAAALNVAADGTTSVNSPQTSASPGDWISLFGTGLQFFESQLPPDGVPAGPIRTLVTAPSGVVLNAAADPTTFSGVDAFVTYAGFAPGLVGVDQINAQLPQNAPEGCVVTVQYEYENGPIAFTQPLTIAIRKGGGPCVDPPQAGYGEVVWQKTVDTQLGVAGQPNVASESDSVTASFQSAPGMTAPALPAYSEISNYGPSPTLAGPACAIPGYRSLASGSVTASQPNGNQTNLATAPYQLGHISGLSIYQAALPDSSIGAGNYTLQASGGTDIGAFQTTVKLGSDIQIVPPDNSQPIWAGCAPFTLDWQGGDSNSWVTVRLVRPQTYPGFEQTVFLSQAHASDHTATINPPPSGGLAPCSPSGSAVIVSVEVDPDPSQISTFTATGLSLGGRATWKYVHTFSGGLVLN